MHVSTCKCALGFVRGVGLTPASVTTYPADPQASDGLRKCINMLERMHYIWPSAWRANELLQGSKAASLSPTMPPAPTPEPARLEFEPEPPNNPDENPSCKKLDCGPPDPCADA